MNILQIFYMDEVDALLLELHNCSLAGAPQPQIFVMRDGISQLNLASDGNNILLEVLFA